MRRSVPRRWCLSLASLIVTVWVSAAWAQLIPGVPIGGSGSETESASDVARIISQAAESGVGVIVIDPDGNVLSPRPHALDTEAPAPEAGTALMQVQEDMNAFRDALRLRIMQFPDATAGMLAALRLRSPDSSLWPYAQAIVGSAILFFIGMLAERYIYGMRIARHVIVPLIRENPQGYLEKMPFLFYRFVGGVIGVLFSMAVAYIIGFAVFGPIANSAVQYTASIINIGYFSVRVILLVWRMILSPYLAQYRIPRMGDREARRLHLWLCYVAIAGLFTGLFSAWLRELTPDPDAVVLITVMLTVVIVLLNILLVLINRTAISGAILNHQPLSEASLPLRLVATFWAPAAILYFILGWIDSVDGLILGNPPAVPVIAGAYGILTSIIVVYAVVNYAIERGFARARAMRAVNSEEAEEDTASEVVEDAAAAPQQITTFEGLARRVAAILAFVAGAYAFAMIWVEDTGMVQNSLPARTLDVIVILFIGYIVHNAFRIWIDDKIREEQGEEAPAELGDEGGGTSASRLATLLPLFRNFVLIVILVTMGLIVLMELGVNVGPLFAGAGIVGVAVGFGSQSLVRDIFSGAFFLFDDAFRKGEYIDVGGVKGTVETISVRSFQLRHHLGALHTIPFGEIQVLTNYSRDWVIMKLPLRVTYDTDVEKVRKLIKKLGQDLLDDPVIGADFIQPLKSQGVIEMQDSAMIIRVKFMTKPGDQWIIRKKVYQEIRALFEREGIKFAHREVTVRLADDPGPEKLTPQQKEAVLAAAEASIEEDLMDAQDMSDDR